MNTLKGLKTPNDIAVIICEMAVKSDSAYVLR